MAEKITKEKAVELDDPLDDPSFCLREMVRLLKILVGETP